MGDREKREDRMLERSFVGFAKRRGGSIEVARRVAWFLHGPVWLRSLTLPCEGSDLAEAERNLQGHMIRELARLAPDPDGESVCLSLLLLPVPTSAQPSPDRTWLRKQLQGDSRRRGYSFSKKQSLLVAEAWAAAVRSGTSVSWFGIGPLRLNESSMERVLTGESALVAAGRSEGEPRVPFLLLSLLRSAE